MGQAIVKIGGQAIKPHLRCRDSGNVTAAKQYILGNKRYEPPNNIMSKQFLILHKSFQTLVFQFGCGLACVANQLVSQASHLGSCLEGNPQYAKLSRGG